MSNLLGQIVEHKRQELERRKQQVDLESLRETITTLGRPRNFFNAVTRKPTRPLNLIAQIMKASPDEGVVTDGIDPVKLAESFASAGADALSVATDQRYFQGHLDHIHAVRDAVKLPVLRNDFILDPYQVYESRAAGADAILLIAEALETSQLIDLQILATEQNMTCVIEVHDMDNLIRVRDAVIGFPHRSYSLLAINNRDLQTGATDIGTTLRLAELVEDREVLICEGGIETSQDVKKLASAGVRAVITGPNLLRGENIAGRIDELFGG